MVQSSRQHQFSRIPQVKKPRSVFDRSRGHKTTFDAGYLVPFFRDEVLPGDTINLSSQIFARLATPIFPVMDNMQMTVFYFFVPMRLVWDNTARFFGEQKNPGDSNDFVTPKVTAPAVTGYEVGSLYDYFGFVTGVPGYVTHNFFARAYNLIWNEWFRDENLQNSVVVDLDDGPDNPSDYVLLRRGKRHDYFTSALPWPQKGPAVELPLTGDAPVFGDGKALSLYNGTTGYGLSTTGASNLGGKTGSLNGNVGAAASGSDPVASINLGLPTSASGISSHAIADLSDVTAATIMELREAITVQQYYELNARGGTRYIEYILSHYGVQNPDFRLQRPEYIGGGRADINITAIAQTSETTEDSPQANLAAIGTVSGRNGFTHSFTEHGFVIGLVCAHADLNYQQGIDRMFTRSTLFDYYDPIFANLGEQAVLNKEIYVQGTANPTEDEAAFGYQERWAEYRYSPNMITGEFRSSYAQSLDAWHWAQDFADLPTLNSAFIQENPPVDRTIAVPTEPHFIFDSMTRVRTARVMPMYSVPGLYRL